MYARWSRTRYVAMLSLMVVGACGPDGLPTTSPGDRSSSPEAVTPSTIGFQDHPTLTTVTVDGVNIKTSVSNFTESFGEIVSGSATAEHAMSANVARLESELAALAARRFDGDRSVMAPDGSQLTLHVNGDGVAKSLTILRGGQSYEMTFAWPTAGRPTIAVSTRAQGGRLGPLLTSVECRSLPKGAVREAYEQSVLDSPCETARKWLASAFLGYEAASLAFFLAPTPVTALALGAAILGVDAAASGVHDACDCYEYINPAGDIAVSCPSGN